MVKDKGTGGWGPPRDQLRRLPSFGSQRGEKEAQGLYRVLSACETEQAAYLPTGYVAGG